MKYLVNQDNTSTIKMMKGDMRVCGSRTRKIHIRYYFYVTERVKDGIIVVTYCPTKDMVADCLSNPSQGSLFCLHCNTLMGIAHDLADQYATAKIAKAKLTSEHLSS